MKPGRSGRPGNEGRRGQALAADGSGYFTLARKNLKVRAQASLAAGLL